MRLVIALSIVGLVACDKLPMFVNAASAHHDTPPVDACADVRGELGRCKSDVTTAQQNLAALPGTLTLRLPFRYRSESLELNHPYDGVTFTEVRYWVSHVVLRRADGSEYEVPDSYYLIDLHGDEEVIGTHKTDASGKQIPIKLPARRREDVTIVNVPAGDYTGLRFKIGIDDAHNDDLSMPGGELHVLSNMALENWMWFTSYIFTKTHGKAGGKDFVWDSGSNANDRDTRLFTFAQPVKVGTQTAATVEIVADLAKLVAAVDPVRRPSIGTTTGADQTLLADAFRDMFTLE